MMRIMATCSKSLTRELVPIKRVKRGQVPSQDSQLYQYHKVWAELSILDGLVMRGDKIFIPQADLGEGEGTLRQWVVELAHDGHVGGPATKRTLRKRIWFPGMDSLVDSRIRTCGPCQAATNTPTRDPLKPTTAPDTPFTKVAADHWGPTPDGHYILVVIDLLSRYPEVAIVKGTAASDNIQALDDIFSRHSPPSLLLTDNGPPFNTNPSHPLQVYLKKMGIRHIPTIAAEDPEANGTCEAFMKHLKKVYHTSVTQDKDPLMELNRHLRSFRTTPHPTTGHIPAEILFGRKVRSNLPDLRVDPAMARPDVVDAKARDKAAKEVMKSYKDKPATVRPHKIAIGDKVLMKQKSTKKTPPS